MRLGGNQERYLLAERSSQASFFITIWFEVRGPLDAVRLKQALAATIARHASLRTGFVHDAEQGFRAIVHAEPHFALHEAEIAGATHDAVARASAAFLGKVADPSDPGALQHYAVLRIAPDHAVIAFNHHHAISDGRSLDIFVGEVADFYSGNPPVAPAADAERVDYTADPEKLAAASAFFRETLGDVSAVPQMHRNLVGAPREMRAEDIALEDDLAGQLNAAATASSPFSLLAAAFAIQVHATTGLRDVLFSIQSSGRARDDLRIGSFSNALPVRVAIDPAESFADLAQRMKGLVRAAVARESLPYHRIQQETGVKPDFAINLYPTAPDLAFAGLTLGPRQFLPSDSDYAVNLRWQRRAGGAAYEGEAYFDAGSVEPPRIASFLRRHRILLERALADPTQSVAQVLGQSREEEAAPAIPAALPPRRIYEEVYAAARAHDARTAILHDGGAIDYADLIERVEALAAAFAAAGVTEGQTVAFLAARTPDFPIAMLALSRIGAAFAAFDTEYPDARLLEQAASLKPDWLIATSLTEQPRLAAFAEAGFRTAFITAGDTGPAAPVPPAAGATDVAYYLFTSGTTGKPRAVGIGHSALPAFLDWERAELGIGPDDRVSLLSGLAHDPVMRDLFLPLTSGAALCIPDATLLRDPRGLVRWLGSAGVTRIHTTPPMGRLISDVTAGVPALPALRTICWGGDLLPQELVNLFNDANPALRQINFYGSTETPQAVAFCDVGREHRHRRIVPIGHAIACTRVSVVGADGQELAEGEVGQLVVDTPYFVRLADRADAPAVGQHYASGDLGYRLPDGDIQLIGRADDQVKVRGYRVELADVQQHIRALPDIADAIVLPDHAPDGSTILLAHVRTDGGDLSEQFGRSILRQLARELPAYMVPAHVFVHERFPLLPNGKIDRAALRGMQAALPDEEHLGGETDAIWSPDERTIADIFQKVTGRPVGSPDYCFADLGADSLNSIQAMLRLESILADLPQDWHERSIRALARSMRGHGGESGLLDHFRLVRLDPAVPLRAFAILAVVAFHFGMFSVGGGLTFVLLFLSGLAFSRFQLGAVLRESTGALASGVIKVAIVALPIDMIYAAKLYTLHSHFWLPTLLFSANLIDYSQATTDERVGIWLWYVGCFLQIYVGLILAFRIRAVRRAVERRPFQWFLAAFLLFAASRFALPALFQPGGVNHIPVMSVWTYLPTAQLGTFLLGVLIELTRQQHARLLLVVALGLLYCLATHLYYPGNDLVVTALSIVAVALIGSVRVPHVAARLMGVISQASLLIYLLHMPFHTVLDKLGHGRLSPLVDFVVVTTLTTIFALQFDKVYIAARDYLHRLRRRAA